VIVDAASSEEVAKEIIEGWDGAVATLYDSADVDRGYVEVVDRRKRLHRYPLCTLSIGIATSVERPISSHWEASEIASEMKSFAKRDPTSSFAIDRRRSDDVPGPGDDPLRVIADPPETRPFPQT
jgi:hypothetical protein